MVLPLLAAAVPIALQIAGIAAPHLGRWIAGDGGEKVANQVVDLAQTVTGQATPDAAKAALQADPALVIELQKHLKDVELALYQAETDRWRAETERLGVVNRTMQEELASNDGYVKRWRPTMGYALVFTWALVMLGSIGAVVYTAMVTPQWAGEVVEAVAKFQAAISAMWMVAFGVLGLSVQSRSKDKQVAAGQEPLGIIGALAARIGGPGG